MNPLSIHPGSDGRGHGLPDMKFKSGMEGKGEGAGQGGKEGDNALRNAAFTAAGAALAPIARRIAGMARTVGRGAKFAVQHPIQATKNTIEAAKNAAKYVQAAPGKVVDGVQSAAKYVQAAPGRVADGVKAAARNPVQFLKGFKDGVLGRPGNYAVDAVSSLEKTRAAASDFEKSRIAFDQTRNGVKVVNAAKDTAKATTSAIKTAETATQAATSTAVKVSEDAAKAAPKLLSNAKNATEVVEKIGAQTAKSIAPYADDAVKIGSKAAGAARLASGLVKNIPIIGLAVEGVDAAIHNDSKYYGKRGKESYDKGETGVKEIWAHSADKAEERWNDTKTSASKTAENFQKGNYLATAGHGVMTGLNAVNTVSSPLYGTMMAAINGPKRMVDAYYEQKTVQSNTDSYQDLKKRVDAIQDPTLRAAEMAKLGKTFIGKIDDKVASRDFSSPQQPPAKPIDGLSGKNGVQSTSSPAKTASPAIA